jgi:hypothetical protein
LLILTEWKQYRSPSFERMRSAMRGNVILDGRNLYDPRRVAEHGFEYLSIGRPPGLPVESEIRAAESGPARGPAAQRAVS